jgi:hypothetical protein
MIDAFVAGFTDPEMWQGAGKVAVVVVCAVVIFGFIALIGRLNDILP